jgi:NAD(P)-dependent dehydrogenase (short-subunit alcohol dehydrogenase family)
VLAEQGADVAVTDMNLAGSQSVADDVAATGRQSVAIQVDVTDRASIQDMVSQVLQRFGTIDILVNDAGIVGVGEWWERERPSDDDWSQVFAVNVRGVVMVSEAVSEHMIERQSGKIVNIASIAARQGSPDLPHYSTSKAAVASWTQSNAAQLATAALDVL